MYRKAPVRRGDIYMADLARDPLSKKSGIRPVVVVQNDAGNASSTEVIVVIVTSRHKKELPTHVSWVPATVSTAQAPPCVSVS